MSDYFDGAVMAYRDCEEFTNKLVDNLPLDLEFLKPQFQQLSDGFREKANKVILEHHKVKEQNQWKKD